MPPETITIDCAGCGREIEQLDVAGEPLNHRCRTCAATGRGPAGCPS